MVDVGELTEKARAEIIDVLKRHQIAGSFTVASSTHAAFHFHIPEWSKVQVCDEGMLQIKATKDERDALESSIHMLFSMQDCSAMLARRLSSIRHVIERHMPEIEHKSFLDHVRDEGRTKADQ